MSTEPTITDADRRLAKEIIFNIGIRPAYLPNHVAYIARIIARHRSEREKRLVEALKHVDRICKERIAAGCGYDHEIHVHVYEALEGDSHE